MRKARPVRERAPLLPPSVPLGKRKESTLSIPEKSVLNGARERMLRSRAGQNLARLYEDLADAERRLAELEESAAARGGALHTERFMEKQKRANVIRMEI